MKSFLFIYEDSCDFICWSYLSYDKRPTFEEARFPKGTSDWEISEDAKSRQRQRQHLDPMTAGECFHSRRLVRIVELARDVTVV